MAEALGGAQFRVLGPLEVLLDGKPVTVGHRRERAVLGVLLLEAGRQVRFGRLIQLAWSGDDPPRTARNALQVSISKLRSTLGDAVQIVTVGEAYRLDASLDSIDVHRFRSLIGQARRLKGRSAIDLYAEADALWRGPVLAGIFSDETRRQLWDGLVEERLQATEERIDLELELGLDSRVVIELSDLVRDHPTRERAVGQLMLALYRSGRQADALAVYRRTRESLVEEVGIEPGRELAQLHRRILNGDASLVKASSSPFTTVTPRRFLPRDVPDFTGREEELRRLSEMAFERTGRSHTVIISAIAGAGGVGKTALAVHWAQGIVSRFPRWTAVSQPQGLRSSRAVKHRRGYPCASARSRCTKR